LKKRSVFLCAAVMLFSAANLSAGSYFSAPDSISTVDQMIGEGDRFSEKSFDNKKSLDRLNEALEIAPGNYEILWRISRAYVDIGEHMPSKTDEEKQKQLETYELALEFAKKAIEVNPEGSMGYVREAIANGRIALFRGIWESIDLVKKTKADCEKAILLDSKQASAYYVLGRTNAKVCEKPKIIRWPLGLGWANMDDAVTNYEKAIELRPDFIMYRLDCARAYVEMDEYEKARVHLHKIASLQKEDEDDDRFRKEAEELLEEIKDKE
jgi:FimV-like protein